MFTVTYSLSLRSIYKKNNIAEISQNFIAKYRSENNFELLK